MSSKEAVKNAVRSVAEREWLSVDDLASELDLPIGTIYAWRARGRGPRAHRIGKYLKFRRKDVELWLATLADPEPSA
jgi:excisionase family DNA binding protein